MVASGLLLGNTERLAKFSCQVILLTVTGAVGGFCASMLVAALAESLGSWRKLSIAMRIELLSISGRSLLILTSSRLVRLSVIGMRRRFLAFNHLFDGAKLGVDRILLRRNSISRQLILDPRIAY